MIDLGVVEPGRLVDVHHPAAVGLDVHHREIAVRAVEVPDERARGCQRGPAAVAELP
jgi:hypothetical protein